MGRAAGRIQKIWEVRQIEEMAVWDEKGSVGMGGRLCKKIGVSTGFNEAEQHQRYSSHPKTQVRVVVHGDDFTFAGTESDLRKIGGEDARVV